MITNAFLAWMFNALPNYYIDKNDFLFFYITQVVLFFLTQCVIGGSPFPFPESLSSLSVIIYFFCWHIYWKRIPSTTQKQANKKVARRHYFPFNVKFHVTASRCVYVAYAYLRLSLSRVHFASWPGFVDHSCGSSIYLRAHFGFALFTTRHVYRLLKVSGPKRVYCEPTLFYSHVKARVPVDIAAEKTNTGSKYVSPRFVASFTRGAPYSRSLTASVTPPESISYKARDSNFPIYFILDMRDYKNITIPPCLSWCCCCLLNPTTMMTTMLQARWHVPGSLERLDWVRT